ncbi:MAG TPA: RNA 2',3'-cyclic phosphodiesterase [Clostridiales bacterium]|nr:RNA 2',3'-cyclic phosphodiesterase [Clostridiales bacterium]
MRLFTAILFNEEVENLLYDSVLRLKDYSKGGTFTAKENLHLTVNFIGETKRLEEVKGAMRRAVEKSKVHGFFLELKGLGRFKRREGDIYWIGVERNETLWRLQKELVKELKEAGFFDIDDMAYTPHMTIGRRIQLKETFRPREFGETLPVIGMRVARLSLMKSERINGKLIYTEIFYVDLEKGLPDMP